MFEIGDPKYSHFDTSFDMFPFHIPKLGARSSPPCERKCFFTTKDVGSYKWRISSLLLLIDPTHASEDIRRGEIYWTPGTWHNQRLNISLSTATNATAHTVCRSHDRCDATRVYRRPSRARFPFLCAESEMIRNHQITAHQFGKLKPNLIGDREALIGENHE